MYKDHFQLRGMPFSIAPDPGYFYLSNQHRDAWVHLGHAVNGDAGVVLLTGEVGAGKTTVCRRLMDELPAHVQVALIFNPRMSPLDLLIGVCRQFGIQNASDALAPEALEALIAAHVAERRRDQKACVLIIDEAQGLQPEVLETLRRLRAAAWDERESLRLVLIGQPELNELLAQPTCAAFNQCITLRYHLGPLGLDDVAAYVAHRLQVAGAREQLIPRRLAGPLHRMSGGIPRVINLICDRALLGAFVLGRRRVSHRLLVEACGEATGREPAASQWWRRAGAVIGAGGLLAAGAVLAVAARPAPPMTGAPAAPLLPVMAAADDASVAGLDPQNPSEWPEGMAGPASERLAFAALLKRWDLPAPGPSVAPCRAVVERGLMCVQGRDEIEALRRLDMPAVLQLVDRQGRQTHVALVQLRRHQAVLQVGRSLRTVSIPVLESQWTRHYTVVWRPPADLKGTVADGAEGAPVAWMRERLARLQGDRIETLPLKLEGRLRSALQDFQQEEGLPVSGAADLRTLMHLASRTEPLAPSLDSRQCGA
ncbi:AAA family ATPase [Roseateles sp. SL47]|uniref:ExeA family protein n=1 Tax=Roseateles sp. SL47 TaxID=2995138 RepID=UPI00226E1527|nr:ExeA family protein [Roseateles sp. SL47]WAC74567.1 AAA family ATPase [Roseateles sp. SL47]